MGLARQIAERIAAMRYEELPPQAVYWSKVAFLDTLGVMLAGAVEEAPRLAARALAAHAGNGSCVVLGTRTRAGCLDAACELTRRHGRVDPARIARVETWTPARRLAHTDRPEPRSNLDAKFSVQYCVARALTAGAVVLEHFEGEAYRDPQVTNLMRRTRSAPHQPGQFAPDNHLGAEVKVTLVDGTSFSAKVELALGRTSRNPIPLERLRAKFENCATRMLAREPAGRVAGQIDGLERMSSVRELTALLEPVADGRGEGAARSAA